MCRMVPEAGAGPAADPCGILIQNAWFGFVGFDCLHRLLKLLQSMWSAAVTATTFAPPDRETRRFHKEYPILVAKPRASL